MRLEVSQFYVSVNWVVFLKPSSVLSVYIHQTVDDLQCAVGGLVLRVRAQHMYEALQTGARQAVFILSSIQPNQQRQTPERLLPHLSVFS